MVGQVVAEVVAGGGVIGVGVQYAAELGLRICVPLGTPVGPRNGVADAESIGRDLELLEEFLCRGDCVVPSPEDPQDVDLLEADRQPVTVAGLGDGLLDGSQGAIRVVLLGQAPAR